MSDIKRIQASGWAVLDKDGKINVRTVSDTRRAAIVNWLVTDKHSMVYGDTTDEEIERRWFQYRGAAEVALVSIAVVGEPHP